MHGIQDNLNERIIVLSRFSFVLRYSHVHSDRWCYWSISIYWTIMVVSSTALLSSYYPDEDRNGLALRFEQQWMKASRKDASLTVRFSCSSDHPLRIVIFVSMIVHGHDIHVDDVFAGRIETGERDFVGWKHTSNKQRRKRSNAWLTAVSRRQNQLVVQPSLTSDNDQEASLIEQMYPTVAMSPTRWRKHQLGMNTHTSLKRLGQ